MFHLSFHLTVLLIFHLLTEQRQIHVMVLKTDIQDETNMYFSVGGF